jgi:hypothetical protein
LTHESVAIGFATKGADHDIIFAWSVGDRQINLHKTRCGIDSYIRWPSSTLEIILSQNYYFSNQVISISFPKVPKP